MQDETPANLSPLDMLLGDELLPTSQLSIGPIAHLIHSAPENSITTLGKILRSRIVFDSLCISCTSDRISITISVIHISNMPPTRSPPVWAPRLLPSSSLVWTPRCGIESALFSISEHTLLFTLVRAWRQCQNSSSEWNVPCHMVFASLESAKSVDCFQFSYGFGWNF